MGCDWLIDVGKACAFQQSMRCSASPNYSKRGVLPGCACVPPNRSPAQGSVPPHLFSSNPNYLCPTRRIQMTQHPRREFFLPVIITLWLFATGVGLRFVLAHEHTPGTVGGVPRIWPLDSRLQRSTKLPTLVMMVHPQCPCSRASIGELAVLLEGRAELIERSGRVRAAAGVWRGLGEDRRMA